MVQEAVEVDTVLSAFLHVYPLYPVECNDFTSKLDDLDTFVKNFFVFSLINKYSCNIKTFLYQNHPNLRPLSNLLKNFRHFRFV